MSGSRAETRAQASLASALELAVARVQVDINARRVTVEVQTSLENLRVIEVVNDGQVESALTSATVRLVTRLAETGALLDEALKQLEDAFDAASHAHSVVPAVECDLDSGWVAVSPRVAGSVPITVTFAIGDLLVPDGAAAKIAFIRSLVQEREQHIRLVPWVHREGNLISAGLHVRSEEDGEYTVYLPGVAHLLSDDECESYRNAALSAVARLHASESRHLETGEPMAFHLEDGPIFRTPATSPPHETVPAPSSGRPVEPVTWVAAEQEKERYDTSDQVVLDWARGAGLSVPDGKVTPRLRELFRDDLEVEAGARQLEAEWHLEPPHRWRSVVVAGRAGHPRS